jgi:hypothetical protein
MRHTEPSHKDGSSVVIASRDEVGKVKSGALLGIALANICGAMVF